MAQAVRAYRSASGRMVAGVARGLAEHLGLPVALVRLAFVVLAIAGGIGIVLYLALWATLPMQQAEDDEDPRARDRNQLRLVALGAIVLGIALFLAAIGADVVSGAVIPIIIAVIGAALIWQQADDDQRASWSATAARAARQGARSTAAVRTWRLVIGVALLLLGAIGLLVNRTSPAQALQVLGTALLLLAGLAIVAYPWVLRLVRDQQEQRRAFIRSEERAEVAAHVHDSVLQTLALIQRNADDPSEVTRLARSEERALRSWLYAPQGDAERTFAARLQRDAAEVEATFSTSIEVVVVGDAAIDPSLGSLLAATREAMLNAAQHAGSEVSVYAELTPAAVEVFVRDRGAGFELAAVPGDRHGIRESIIGRMERIGGTAEIITSSGQGTEVRLQLQREEAS
ncbi:MAG: PspC domain-containing protein [Candidatus Nanopelagicales bacterium]|nr:PspC domain-containing protein [Candidatus Nanopelagicales bacterium]